MEHPYNTVDQIITFDAKGPWKTSTGSNLAMRVAVPVDWVRNSFLGYDQEELQGMPQDIRGLRIYTVRNLPLGKRSSSGFHKVRGEMALGLEGKVELECEDVFGNSKKFIITPETGIWMPPYLLQTHQALEDNSGLILIANTLFFPDDKETHDSYSVDEFRNLQTTLKSL